MNIAGNDNFPANVRVIDDGDTCSNAEHGATAQDLADRTKWAYLRLNPFWAGGTVAPTGPVVIDLSGGSWTFQGDDDFNIELGAGVQFFANGRMAGPLFTAGRTGRANRKPSATLTGAGPHTIRPDLYDTFVCNCSGAVILNIDPAGTYVEGDSFKVVNIATSNGYTVTIKHSSGTVTVMQLLNAFTSTTGFTRPMTTEIMRTGAGGWMSIFNDSLV